MAPPVNRFVIRARLKAKKGKGSQPGPLCSIALSLYRSIALSHQPRSSVHRETAQPGRKVHQTAHNPSTTARHELLAHAIDLSSFKQTKLTADSPCHFRARTTGPTDPCGPDVDRPISHLAVCAGTGADELQPPEP
jgi:hypothetical protein